MCDRSVADRFDISKGTLFLFFSKFVVELSGMADRFIKWPTNIEMVTIKRQYYRIAGLDDWIIGAVDGTYVVIPAPKEDAHVFRTRKCNFAITLQAICIPTLHFIDCFVGFPGSVGDRRIFEYSPIYKNIIRARPRYFPSREYIIGDKAYPILEWCQAPYIRRRILNAAEELYNTILSSTRQVIERAFGLLFGRFRRLKFLDMHRHDLMMETVQACCVLHNICLSELDYEEFINEGLPHVRQMNDTLTTPSLTQTTSLLGSQRRIEVTTALYRQHLSG